MRNPLARASTGTSLKLHGTLAAVAYLPLLLTRPGWVSADTKTYLYLDPGRLMSRAWSMWDPTIGLGTVTHQNIGYLWPMGPFYWVTERLGIPDWASQRLWWGTIIFAAGAGVAYLLRVLGWRGPGVVAAVYVYALTPYILTLVSRLSAILLPFSALPWLVALTIQTVRHKGWRHPALFALVVTTCGSVNATALLLAGLGPVLWLVHSVWGAREVPPRTAVLAALRIGVLTLPTSAWWIAGLSVQSTNGIDILRYTETAEVVSAASVSHEVLRGLGYWFFYGTDRLGPWIEPSVGYTQWLPLLLLTYLIPIAGIGGAVIARWRHRAYFVLLVALGTALAVGAYPWDEGPPFARLVQAFQGTDAGLAMRSLPRAVPLVVLGMAVLLGSGVASLARRWPQTARPMAIGVAVVAVLALPPLWLQQFVPDNLRRPAEVPEYWQEAADHVDAAGNDTRVLVVPGTDFASYRWGNTVDPILPGMIDRPSVQRELIPYGSPASANLLNAFDLRLQERTADPDAVAAIARLLRAGDVLVQSDLQYERFNTPRPRNFWDFVLSAPGLGEPAAFGPDDPNVTIEDVQLDDEVLLVTDPSLPDPPAVAVFPVEDPVPLVTAHSMQNPLVVAGDGAGLVEAAGAGLIDGTELIRYSASLDDDDVAAALDNEGALLLTDSNRKRGERWTTVRHTRGYTETANGGALEEDAGDNRLPVFPDAGTETMTVVDRSGDIDAEATSYGNPITFSPEERPILAVDGDPQTAWRAAAFSSSVGERIELTLRRPATTDQIRLLQPIKGPATRFITEVRLRFDDGTSFDVELTEQSRVQPGQT
ncbi:MAG TPA: alpha-(1-_3)-arabinofuranosyltransferase family protein, partial [Acidimicrobiales bacterium]